MSGFDIASHRKKTHCRLMNGVVCFVVIARGKHRSRRHLSPAFHLLSNTALIQLHQTKRDTEINAIFLSFDLASQQCVVHGNARLFTKNIPFSFRTLLLEELTILNKKNAENIAE